MANNIVITPASARINFSGSVTENIKLEVSSNGDIQFIGDPSGLLLSISETSSQIVLATPTQIQDQLYLGSGSIISSGNMLVTGTGISDGITLYNNTGSVKRIWNDDSDGSLNITIGDTKNNGFRIASDGSGYLGNSRILTVSDEGSGNGIDADTLDTYEATAFPRKAEDATISGDWTFNGQTTFVDTTVISTGDNIILLNNDVTGVPVQDSGIEVERGTDPNVQWLWDESEDYWSPMGELIGGIADPTTDAHVGDRGYNDLRYAPISHTHPISEITSLQSSLDAKLNASAYTAADVLSKLLTVDGAGTNLDADLLDGQEGAYYLPAASYTAADVLSKLLTVDGATSALDADLLDGQHGTYYLALSNATGSTSDISEGTNLYYTTTRANTDIDARVNKAFVDALNVNADTLDSYDSSAFPRKAENATISGNWTFNGQTTFVDTTIISTGDNIILLNNDVTGTPTEDSGIEVERGTSANVSWLWDESEDYWSPMGDLIGGIGDPTTGAHVGDRDYNDARYAAISHTHPISEITNLQTSLDAKLDSSSYTAADVLTKLLTVDGAASALDADLLDGQHGTYYLALSNATGSTSDISEGTNLYYTTTRANTAIDARVNKAYVDALNINADTLDTYEAADFLLLSGGVLTGSIDMNGQSILLDVDGDSNISSPSDDLIRITTGAATSFEATTNRIFANSFGFLNYADAYIEHDGSGVRIVDDNGLVVRISLSGLELFYGSVFLNGGDLILDSDNDTYWHASSDDVADLVVNSTERIRANTSGGSLYGVWDVDGALTSTSLVTDASLDFTTTFAGVNKEKVVNSFSRARRLFFASMG